MEGVLRVFWVWIHTYVQCCGWVVALLLFSIINFHSLNLKIVWYFFFNSFFNQTFFLHILIYSFIIFCIFIEKIFLSALNISIIMLPHEDIQRIQRIGKKSLLIVSFFNWINYEREAFLYVVHTILIQFNNFPIKTFFPRKKDKVCVSWSQRSYFLF